MLLRKITSGTRPDAWAERTFLVVTRRQHKAGDKQERQASRICQPNKL